MAKARNHEIADKFIKTQPYLDDLVYCLAYDSFYEWKEGWYKLMTSHELKRTVQKFLIKHFSELNINMALISDVTSQIKLMCIRQEEEEHTNFLAFNDGLLNLNTFEMEDIDRNIFATFHFDCLSTDLKMDTPNFEHFLKTSLIQINKPEIPDEELISFVQEMFGVFLLDNMDAASAFFLVGNGSNGKSVLTYTLQALFGREFCSAMSIQTLTTRPFAVEHLIGKKINISNEEESKYMQADKFKALITGDMVEAERKFGANFEFIPRTKYIFSSNNMPTFGGIDYGLKRRIKIIPFYRKFKPGEGDPKLRDKIKAEIPGIIRWAIEGAKRLMENNYVFTTSTAIRRSLDEFEAESSSSLRFARDHYTVSKEGFVSNDYLYGCYKDWCYACGKKALNKFGFLKDLQDNIDGLERKWGRVDGKSCRGMNLAEIIILDEEAEFAKDFMGGGKPVDTLDQAMMQF